MNGSTHGPKVREYLSSFHKKASLLKAAVPFVGKYCYIILVDYNININF